MQSTRRRQSLNITRHIGVIILKLKQMQSNEANRKQREYTQVRHSALEWSSTHLLNALQVLCLHWRYSFQKYIKNILIKVNKKFNHRFFTTLQTIISFLIMPKQKVTTVIRTNMCEDFGGDLGICSEVKRQHTQEFGCKSMLVKEASAILGKKWEKLTIIKMQIDVTVI